MKKLEFSVVIPTFNRAGLIGETLESLLGQTYSPTEIVIVDDGSTDDTEDVVRRFGSDIRYLHIPNSGQSNARNIGVAESRCEWVAFCDSDDLWKPNKLQQHVELVEAEPAVEYTFSNFQLFGPEDAWQTDTKFDSAPEGYWDVRKRVVSSDCWVLEEPFFLPVVRFQPIFVSTLVMTRSFYQRMGGFRLNLPEGTGEDFEFTLRCVRNPQIGVVVSPTAGIRRHPGNISGGRLRLVCEEIEVLNHCLKYHQPPVDSIPTIQDSIALRSAQAAELAFVEGKMDLVKRLAANAGSHRSAKLMLKEYIARLPSAVATPLSHATLRLSDWLQDH
jgi:GT2 family glycosyltransferase